MTLAAILDPYMPGMKARHGAEDPSKLAAADLRHTVLPPQ
jgi:hypothetical protein